jgi:hypothetical protein
VSFARLARRVFNEKIVTRENGERRTISKWQAALKQLANKAASGNLPAIRELVRLQAAIAGSEKDNAQPLVVKIVRFGDENPD